MTPLAIRHHRAILLAACVSLGLAGCGKPDDKAQTPAAAEVAVVKVAPQALTVADELPGRVIPFRIAEIRPQVGGIIQRRLFEQGSEVRAGQPLYQINVAPFRAEAASAAAALQRAQAALSRARTQAERLRPLVEADAISGQSYDDAVAARAQASADVAQGRADVRRRRLDLGFATIRSPISGRIDQAVVTEGALAAVGDATPLATVQQIDQVYIDVRQPAARIEALRKAARAGGSAQGAPVTILSSDGSAYPMQGRLLFSGITVDPGTGEVIARVLVTNPGRALLPGMFVRARLPRLSNPSALTVPQQAVRRDAAGKPQLSVVDNQGRVHLRAVILGDEMDGRTIVTSGLRAGETIVVAGHDRIQPGIPINPVPWRAPAAKAR